MTDETRAPKPLLVGESNPYGADPYFALYPAPDGCAGERLCRLVMGLRRKTYLDTFERANLLKGPRWSVVRARKAASELIEYVRHERPGPKHNTTIVLLGRKVGAAFGVTCPGPRVFPPVPPNDLLLIALPHPSGRNRRWNAPETIPACRDLLRQILPHVPFGEIDEKE